MADEAQAAPSGPISLDQFAAELTAEQEKAAAPVDEIEEEKPADEIDPEAADVEEEQPTDDDGDADDEESDEEEEVEKPAKISAVEPPRSWSKDDHAAWALTPPAAQAVIMRREADRDNAVAQAHQKTSELTKTVTQIADEYAKVEPLLQDEFKQRWGDVDWGRVAHDDAVNGTANWAKWRSQMEAEKEALEAVTAEREKSSQLVREAFLAREGSKMAELVPELLDPVKGPEERRKIGAYLLDYGFDVKVLEDISAAELSIARKARLYDEAQAEAKKQAANPKKAPVIPPKVISPASGAPVSPKRALQGLNDRLTKKGGLDAFAALMTAEQEQGAKKQVRR